MTATITTPAARRLPAKAARFAASLTAALGCGALAARPAFVTTARHPAMVLVLLFATLLVVGISAPLPAVARRARDLTGVLPIATALGVAAFAVGRIVAGGHAPMPLTLWAVAANTLAAVAEEVWFRRLCYGLLAPAGPACAIAGSSILFAAAHVSTYGFSILPLDLAAGALLGWQRHVTGSWAAPACTHALANLIVLL